MSLIEAFDKRTGKRVAIPERWLGSRLGAGYSRTPPTKSAPKASPAAKRSDESTPAPVAGDTTKEM